MIFYLGHKAEEVKVDDKTRLARNKAKSWKYGYDESIDVIIISKDGTLGEIYYINGLLIGFPQKPEHKEIINWDKTAANQKWKRQAVPDGLNEETQFNPKYTDFIEDQFQKREEGVWIYLNGKAIYFTGTYWFFLQYYNEMGFYPNLRIIQSELMIYWEACKADDRSYGIDYVKNRRFGWSALCNNEQLESGTKYENKILGTISKKGNDAKKMFVRLVRAFKKLPPYFMPIFDGHTTPKTELVFSEPSKKRKAGEGISEGEGLDSIISWHNTELNAMDGEQVFRSSIDECFGLGTKILMGDLTHKNIEEIIVGDYVTIEGGKKVRVGKTFSGSDEMFKISQPYGSDYVVNSKHRLYLEQRCKTPSIKDDGIKIMTPTEFLKLDKYRKRTTFGLRSSGLDFDKKEVKIDPYILGLWLGDGLNDSSRILVNIVKDKEIGEYIEQYVKQNNFSLAITKTASAICKKYSINRPEGNEGRYRKLLENKFRTFLKDYNLLKNKHIPIEYIENDREVRLNVLAGLLDSDGYLCVKQGLKSYHYQLALSKKDLLDNALFLIRSLGFKATTSIKKTNFNTICYKLNIHGDLSEIPCKLERKKVPATYKRQYATNINKISVESIGVGKYYGIQVESDNDDNRRLLLEDFTISMNCGKWPKDVPFSEYWQIVKTAHRLGSNIVGKAMVGSTVNAMKKGGAEFKKIWDDSDPLERNKNGQTKSGLYRIFIDAAYCLEGFFDLFGFSIVEDPAEPVMNDLGKLIKIGSDTYLKNELESLKEDPEKYNEFMRQFPRSERDAFRDEATDCSFNLMKINEQIDHNEFEAKPDDVERGNLSWVNGIQDTTVQWNENPNGRFWIAKGCHPTEDFRNKKEKKMINGILAWAPTALHIGCIGVDPYNRSKTVDSRGSKGAAHLSTKTNTSALPNEAFIVEYIDRPATVELFFEDMLMMMVYYSMPMLCELSNEKFLTMIKDRGYRHFSMNNPLKNWTELSHTEQLYGGIPPQDAKVGAQQFFAVETYIEDRIGVARESGNRLKGEMGFMPFTRTLMQWKDVDPNQRTKFDAYISSSLSLLGNQKLEIKMKAKEPRRIPFTRYNNSGNTSVRQ